MKCLICKKHRMRPHINPEYWNIKKCPKCGWLGTDGSGKIYELKELKDKDVADATSEA